MDGEINTDQMEIQDQTDNIMDQMELDTLEVAMVSGKHSVHPSLDAVEAPPVKGLDPNYLDNEMARLSARGFNIDRDKSEETKWEVLKNIRNMPTNIAIKRSIKRKMLAGTCTKMSSWQMWKQENKIRWASLKRAYREMAVYVELWGQPMRRIEGKHGASVLSYFVFLKWLLFLNAVMFVAIFVFLVLPQSLFPATNYTQSVLGSSNSSSATALAMKCSVEYVVDVSSDPGQLILDMIQGTGWIEKTVMFYGAYVDTEVNVSNTAVNYNLPLAYITIVIFCFLMCLIIMARTMGKTFRRSIANSDVDKTKWTTSVLCGWDYSIYVASAAEVKKKSIYHEIFVELNEERQEFIRQSRTRGQKCALYSLRILVNFIIILLLGASAYLIYWVTNYSTRVTKSPDYKTTHDSTQQLVIEYLPSVTISALTGVLPAVFNKLVVFEKYRPVFELNLSLVRTVFLKLASLSMLVITLYVQISCETRTSCNVGTGTCSSLLCWETYVGQQFYKLIIMDFIVTLVMVLVVEVTRKLVVTYCKCWLTRIIGYQDFDITKNVLDLVYSQTLCWLGFFFAPLVTPMCVIKLVILFYLKMVSSLFLCVPTDRPYKASKTNSFFIAILFIAFFLTCIPVGWTISELAPSRGCGPFRVHENMYGIYDIAQENWSPVLHSVWQIITSPAIVVSIVILLCLAIYYYSVLHKANRDMVKLLRQQLLIEARDKQFLLYNTGRNIPPPTRKLRPMPQPASMYGSKPATPVKTITPVKATPPPQHPHTPQPSSPPPLTPSLPQQPSSHSQLTPNPPQYHETAPIVRGLDDF